MTIRGRDRLASEINILKEKLGLYQRPPAKPVCKELASVRKREAETENTHPLKCARLNSPVRGHRLNLFAKN